MSTPLAGPSQPPPSYPAVSSDLKRRLEADPELNRRIKQTRPPLPPPQVLATLVPDSSAFIDLMKVEQRLDWTLLRQRSEINDALGRPLRVKRALRVFISNTAHDQPWQIEADRAKDNIGDKAAPADDLVLGTTVLPISNESGANKRTQDVTGEINSEVNPPSQNIEVNSGKGIAGWVLRVEGRLLDSGNARLDKTRAKFSSFIRSAMVEFDDRTAPTYPEGNTVEWHSQTLSAPLDGFEVHRRGDKDVTSRIVLHIAHYPERFKVLSPLADLISLKEGTRSDVMNAFWKLVKVAGAQDKEDATIVHPVGGLEKIIPTGQDSIPFHQLPELATRFLTHPEPVVLPYTLRVDQDFTFGSKCFDIPIEIEDPSKSKLSSTVAGFEGDSGKEIVKLEDKVGELAYFSRDLKQKRDFLESFASNPQVFIQNWLAAQARDLDQMLGFQIGDVGTNGGSVREEDLRRSDLFQLPWVDEAINVHEASRMDSERRALR